MAKDDKATLDAKLTKLQDKITPDSDTSVNKVRYNPGKRLRRLRRKTYERYYELRDDPKRTEAEADWEMADKEYGMVTDEVNPADPDSWMAHLHLPDAFAGIQAQSQEDIERKARPSLVATQDSDEPIAEFANSVMNYNMDSTGFDYQYFLGKLSRAIRGTAFFMDYWRTDKRIVKDPVELNEDGTIKYQDKEITDFDDDYLEWVPNEYIYIDEKAKHIDEAVDGFRREILNIDEFHRIYDERPGFMDTEFVTPGGETTTRSYFKLPKDVTEYDVEVLHYYNRAIDAYWVVANNILIHEGPLPWKHKELPFAVLYQYRIPGQFYGIGIPKVIHHLSEERKSIRNLNMDRQKIIVGGAFLHNNAFDIDEEDEVVYPGKFISVDTGGRPVGDAIQQLNMGEVPPSYFRTEEILLEDIRRAHGIDDRIQGVNVGGTATEAAILKESALKRVNLISISAEMDTVLRIGRLKWSNIQFFYDTPRIEKITKDNDEEIEEKTYRTVSIKGRKFSIVTENGKKQLRMEDVQGASALELKPEMAKYLEGSFDIHVDSDVFTPISKAIEQTKKTEMFSLVMSNPASMSLLDLRGAMSDVLSVNNIKPDRWMKNSVSQEDTQLLAESENMIMAAGQPLNGTEDATEEHTLVHLMFTKTDEFKQLPAENQQLIADHIMQEHDNNPAVGPAADLVKAYGLTDNPVAGQPGSPVPGSNTPFQTQPGGSAPPQAQTADLQPTNFSQGQ